MGQAALAAEKRPRGKLRNRCPSTIQVRQKEEGVWDMLHVMSVGCLGRALRLLRSRSDATRHSRGVETRPAPTGEGAQGVSICRHPHLAALGPVG